MAEQTKIAPKFDTTTAHFQSVVSFTGSDLIATKDSGSAGNVHTTCRLPETGKYYFEFTIDTYPGPSEMRVGICPPSSTGLSTPAGNVANSWGFRIDDGIAARKVSGGSAVAYGNAPTVSAGDVIGLAVDLDNNAIWISVNDSWIDGDGTDSSATVKSEIEAGTTTSAMFTGIAGITGSAPEGLAPSIYVNNVTTSVTFGPTTGSWTGSAPSGFSQIEIDGAAWNPENSQYNSTRISSGNYYTRISSSAASVISFWGASTGKFHWEILAQTATDGPRIGIFVGDPATFDETADLTTMTGAYVVQCVSNAATTAIWKNGTSDQTSLPLVASGSIVSIEFNATDGEISFFDDGTQIGTTLTGVTAGTAYAVLEAQGTSSICELNMGRSAFAMTPTSGFEAVDAIPPTEGAVEITLAVDATASNDTEHGVGGTEMVLGVTSTASNNTEHGVGGAEMVPVITSTATRSTQLFADGIVEITPVITGTASNNTEHGVGGAEMVPVITATATRENHADGAVTLNLALAGGSTATISSSGSVEMVPVINATAVTSWHANGSVELDTLAITSTASTIIHAAGGAESTFVITSGATVIPTFRLDTAIPVITFDGFLDGGSILSTGAESPSIPLLTSDGIYVSGNICTLDAPIPALTSAGLLTKPGLEAALPALEISGRIEAGALLSVNRELPSLEVFARFSGAGFGTLNRKLTKLRSSGTIVAGNTLTLDTVLRALTIRSTAVAGSIAVLEKDLPSFTANVVQLGEGLGSLAEPLPTLRLLGMMLNAQAFVPSSYSLNTENFGLATYDNFNYLYLGAYGTKFFGVKSDGVYELAGADDVGTQIDASIVTGLSDLGSEHLKRATKAYIGYTSDGDMDLSIVIDGEPAPRTYELRRENYASGQKHARVSLSRGIKSKYWKVGIQNKLGADFEIDVIGLLAESLSRKT